MTSAATARVDAPARAARQKRPAGSRRMAPPLEHRILMTATLCLLAFGAVMVYSASSATTLLQGRGNGSGYLIKFVTYGAIGLLLMRVLARDGVAKVQAITPPLLFTSFVLVLAVHVPHVGVSVNGARRWIALGIMSVQPSEFAKVVLVVALAALLSRREDEMDVPARTLLPVLGLVVIPAGLVLLEPDFGTALTYFAIAAAMLFYAGLPLKWFLGSALLLVPTISAWVWSAQYRRDRLLAFLHPEADPLGRGFHAIQSLIAVGTGGLTGRGLGQGKQKLFFLPYPYTDFIYAIVGEELGLIGCVAVLALFGLVFARGVRAAVNAPDSFGRLLGIGLSVMIIVQALVNISVVLSLVPTKGIPLPFLSYGGSALWTDLLAIGILLNLSQHAS